jgi:hypothetical protein
MGNTEGNLLDILVGLFTSISWVILRAFRGTYLVGVFRSILWVLLREMY